MRKLPHQQLDYLYTCIAKLRFDDREVAEVHASEHPGQVEVYQCPYCQLFHLRNKRKRMTRENRLSRGE